MKIVHVSDIHICVDEVARKLQPFVARISSALGIALDVGFADEGRLERLTKAIVDLRPDLVCISGDLTTFGDRASFERARKFVNELRNTGAEVVVTPGNHDVMAAQMWALMQRKDWPSRLVRWFWVPVLTWQLRRFLRSKLVEAATGDALANFRKFLYGDGISSKATIERKEARVVAVAFESVSPDALWMNLGEGSKREYQKFSYAIESSQGKQNVTLAVVHHNPISSPDTAEARFVHAYNSFPGASVFLKQLQLAGVDFVLYGHQHLANCALVDFFPDTSGHLHLIGAASATDPERAGFNLLEVKSAHTVEFREYAANASGHFVPQGSRLLHVERERVKDGVTNEAQRELRLFKWRFADSEEEAWDQMHVPGASDLLIVGPRLRVLSMKPRQDSLRKLLADGCRVRVLIQNPSVLSGAVERGEGEAWQGLMTRDQAREGHIKAEHALKSLREFVADLDATSHGRVTVKFAPDLLPIGAVVRDGASAGGSMLVRLLPLGANGYIERPLLKLDARNEYAIFSYYCTYLEHLWQHGREEEFERGSHPRKASSSTGAQVQG